MITVRAIWIFPRQTILRFHPFRGHILLWQKTAETFFPVSKPLCLGDVVPLFPFPNNVCLPPHGRPYIGVFPLGAKLIVAHFLGSQWFLVKQHTPRPKRPAFYRLSYIKVYKRIRRPGCRAYVDRALGRVVDVDLFFYCDPTLQNRGVAPGPRP